MLGRDCLFFSTFSLLRALFSFSFSRSFSLFSFLFLSIFMRKQYNSDIKFLTFEWAFYKTGSKTSIKGHKLRRSQVSIIESVKTLNSEHIIVISTETYRCRAPPVLPLGDVRGAGRHPPAVRTSVVGLVGAQSQGTG